MKRDHKEEHKVLRWRKEDYPKWRRFVDYFAKVRNEDRWSNTDMGYDDVVIEFEKLENE